MDTFKEKILDKLSEAYPSPRSELDFTNPLECLIATMLSAQCTDQRVNLVTKDLFDEFKSPEDYLVLDNHELEERIKSCNYYKTKSKHILETCKILHLKYNGEVPNTRSGLMELPGVGRKTANVVLSNAFGTPAIAVDTHVFRVANRLGIVKAENVTETEKQLMDAIPEEKWSDAHHWLILHGRRICKARKPLCEKCSVTNWCKYFKNQIMGDKV
ncbi:MAG: endonuclease III [Tindallia sp. MSAO_Bac2]|nr:MAG: endonuclease III [Tindallia sp. MSAO_Bac2]